MSDTKNIGMITEQGDLGLGFEKLSEKDAKALSEQKNTEKENDE